jgi:hypothetical protein
MTDSMIERLRQRAVDASLATDQAETFPRIANAPLDDQLICRAETLLGRALPPFLRDAYRFVGNGGFGPGYGLLPLLLENPGSSDDDSVVNLYTAFCSSDPEDSPWAWPPHLLPFCDWGCAIRSCIDCSTQSGPIVTFDPNVYDIGEPLSNAFARTHTSLEAWFSDWLAGVRLWDIMFEPDASRATSGINPFTKKPFVFVPTKLRRR